MKNVFVIGLLFIFVQNASAYLPSKYYHNLFDGPASKKLHKSLPYMNVDHLVGEFEHFMETDKKLKTDNFINFLKDVIRPYCIERFKYNRCQLKYYYHALNILRTKNVIDNLFYLIVDDKIRNPKATLIDLSFYLKSLKSLYRKRINSSSNHKPIYDLSFLHTRKISQHYGSYKGLTPRQVLYLKYSSYQIKLLGYQMKKMLSIMNSQNAYIFVDMHDDNMQDIRIDLSYSEKYRLGVKLLRFHLNELTLDPQFGFKPRFIDVLIAGVETGAIDPKLLKELYMASEFYDSYRSRHLVYRDILLKIGKTALINVPYIGQISLIPILLFEVRAELNKSKQGEANDTHLF